MGGFLFSFASSPLLFITLERGKTLFDTILPDGKGEKEGAQFRTNHSKSISWSQGEGQNFVSTAQLGGF